MSDISCDITRSAAEHYESSAHFKTHRISCPAVQVHFEMCSLAARDNRDDLYTDDIHPRLLISRDLDLDQSEA